MKKILILILFLVSFVNADAQRAFIRQNVSSNVYYQVDSVFLTALQGDTIYLPGGSYQINNLNITKKLHVFGVGHFPDSTQATFPTLLTGNIFILNGSNGSSFEGFSLSGNFQIGTNAGNETVSQIEIKRCSMSNIYLGSNYYGAGSASYINIQENIVNNELRGCQAQFVNVERNLIQGGVTFFNGNLLIKNNTFVGGMGCPSYMLSDLSNSTIENNIFMNNGACGNATISGLNSCVFMYNVFNHPSYAFPYGSNAGVGNMVAISYTGFFVNDNNYQIGYSDDFHLQSAAVYLGSDGTQVGIYGTSSPFKPSSVPINPHIRSKNISTTTDASGNLNISIGVGAQQQ